VKNENDAISPTLNIQNESVVLRITETTLAEFLKSGRVPSARCDVCGSLIELKWLGTWALGDVHQLFLRKISWSIAGNSE
jgi:hypothetical protein